MVQTPPISEAKLRPVVPKPVPQRGGGVLGHRTLSGAPGLVSSCAVMKGHFEKQKKADIVFARSFVMQSLGFVFLRVVCFCCKAAREYNPLYLLPPGVMRALVMAR